MVDRLLTWIAGTEGEVLALIAFGLAFGEAAIGLDLIVPGEAGMVVVGAATDRKDMALWSIILAGGAGAAVGDSLSYALGRRYGLHLAQRWAFTRRHVEPALLAAEARFERHGGAAVAGARWVGALRAVVPAVAGAAKMPFGRFLLWNVPSCMAWAAVTVTLGAVFGEMIVGSVDTVSTAISGVALVIIVALLLRRRRHATRRPLDLDGAVAIERMAAQSAPQHHQHRHRPIRVIGSLMLASIALLGGSGLSCDRGGPRTLSEDDPVSTDLLEQPPRDEQEGKAQTRANVGDPDSTAPQGPYGGTNLTQCLSGLPAPC